MQTLLPADEIVELNDRFETAHPREILAWALERSRSAASSASRAASCDSDSATRAARRPSSPARMRIAASAVTSPRSFGR